MSSLSNVLNPRVFGLRVSVLFGLYRNRLRRHAFRELLAGGGIAVGVALVFGVLVANGSVLSSARGILDAVNGSASLEVSARSPLGFDQRLTERVSGLRGVRDAVPLLRENAVIEGPSGGRSVQLVGVSLQLFGLRGAISRKLAPQALRLANGVALPSGVAEAIGAKANSSVTLLVAGAAGRTRVQAVLNAGAIGALSSSGLVVTQLSTAQALARVPGRITELLVSVAPGRQQLVASELRRLASGKLDVLPADAELRSLQQTAKPTSQSSELFAAIGLMVGFLLALNATLLVIPERRREIAEMRCQGYDSKQVLAVFIFQALILGIVASAVGITIGDVLARTMFANAPIYLSVAFPISGQQTISLATALTALGAGVGAALIASLIPILLDLTSKEPVDAVLNRRGEAGQQINGSVIHRLGFAGALIVICVSIAVGAVPGLTVAGGVVLAVAALCFTPMIFSFVTRALRRLATTRHGGMLAVAVIELDAGAIRAVALAGVAALAVYGSTAVDGARRDLSRGLDQTFAEYIDTANLWVTTNGNNLTVNNFPAAGSVAAVAREPDVASVRIDQGEYLDVGSRRMWIIARPSDARVMLPAGQVIEGESARANALLRGTGWAAVSNAFALERHLGVGDRFTLPTPSGPASFKVAAITTNLGWPPGAITLNTTDYGRYWQTGEPSALEVDLKPRVSEAQGKHEVESALTGRPGLRVQTAGERIAQFQRNASQGLHSLAEIATLLLLTAALALAAALSSVIYQRREQFVLLKEDGFDRWQLWRSLLIESVALIGIGCLDGAVLGVYGHALANRYLRLSTGFPAPFGFSGLQVASTLLLLAGVSLAVIALPGYIAAGASTTHPTVRE